MVQWLNLCAHYMGFNPWSGNYDLAGHGCVVGLVGAGGDKERLRN